MNPLTKTTQASDIIFKPNKKGIYYLISNVTVITIVVMILMFIINQPKESPEVDTKAVNISTVIILVGIVLYAMYPKIQLLFSNTALVITNKGITDYTIPLGFVPWEDLTKAEQVEETFSLLVRKVNIIELELRNPQEYFSKLSFNRTGYFSFRQMRGKTPFYFDLRYISEEDFKLIDEIQKHLEA